ncbi:MAG TPA: hypothetical protein VGI99_01705 [Gemmataceae bacterium]
MIWFLIAAFIIGLALALQAGLVAFAGYVLLGDYLISRFLARRWADYFRRRWDETHSPDRRVESISMNFMRPTAAPG